jgi:hypothetical protein
LDRLTFIKRNRKAIALLKNPPRPAVHTWAAHKVFNRIKGEKYADLVMILRDDKFQTFCSAIGWVEVNWALYENQLTHWCQIMWVTLNWHGHGRSKEDKIPRAYSRKERYLRAAFGTVPQVAQFKDDAIAIFDRAKELAEVRDDLTHGVITHMEPIDGKFYLSGLQLKADGSHSTKDIVFDSKGFPELGEKIVKLGRDALYLSHRMQEVLLK